MEVRDKRVDDAEAIAGHDEERGVAGARGHVPDSVGRALDRAQRRRADGDHAAALGLRTIDARGHVFGHVEPFRMHLVFRKILDANGLKGPRADVKRDILDVDPLGRKPAEKILGEVKAGRWSGHGAGIAGIDRLIAALVGLLRRMRDVGRKWNATERLENVEYGTLELKFEELALTARHHDGLLDAVGLEVEDSARLRGLAGANHGDSGALARDALNQGLDVAARGLAAEQAGLDDLGVVGDKQVAFVKKALDVRERAVLDHVLRDVQKTRCSAVFKGILGDELRRELEIEIG